MLNAKCHAIRDAQILEREEIKQDIQSEETRLDTIREVHRLNAIKEAEREEQAKQIKRIEGARQIMDQIKSNTVARILEEEKKNAESGTSGWESHYIMSSSSAYICKNRFFAVAPMKFQRFFT